MKHENEFDELARQKLEGRSIAFEESDWTAMQGLLKAEKSDRGGVLGRLAKWLGGAALLTILGIGIWKYIDHSTEEKGRTTVATTVVENTNSTEVPSTPLNGTTERSEQELHGSNTTSIQQEVDRTAAISTGSQGPSGETPWKTEKPEVLANVASNNERTNKARQDLNTQGSTSTAVRKKTPSTNDRSTTVVPTSVKADVIEPAIPIQDEGNSLDTGVSNEGTTIADVIMDPSETPVVSMGNEDGPAQKTDGTTVANDDPGEETPSPDGIGTTATTIADPPASKDSEPSEANSNTPTTPDGIAMATTTPPINNSERPADPDSSAMTPKSKTSSEEQEGQIQPSVNDTNVVAPEPPPIAPLITPRSPWQLSVFGGAVNTNTRYSGANSEEWNTDIQKQWTANAGVELVHMGKNIGIGTGLHYSTYSEQIEISEKNRNTLAIRNFWYLSPIDTTILFITDTIQQGGQTVYVGQSVQTTINVLAQGTDSTNTTTRLRDARSTRNKVSYVEIPLLLDAHLVQGRWSIGLRGGPTVGLLTGRKGSLPNSNGEGYTTLNDQPFREVVFGWTARAYVRYRFNAAWSIGLEPMMRGQLFNTLGSGDLSRKATGYGGVLSLSYLLR
ncbi:MAG: outer membrane beta-barrel protein [Flavobacteriales bacterium]|nr:outer membrane beta-barrel protein [Flavobacteriales bacterium]